MPIQRGGLQVQEEEEQSRFLSVLWNHTSCPHVAAGVDRARCRPAYKASRGARKGKELDGCFRYSVTVPSSAFRLAASTHLNCAVQFLVFSLPYFKKVTSKILIRKGYFILLFCTPPLPAFSHLTKKKYHPETLASFHTKLKMAMPSYSHNGIDSVCVGCVLLFFLNYEYV